MDPIYPSLHPNQMEQGQYAQQPQGQYVQQPTPGQHIQQPQPGQYVQQPTPGQYLQQPSAQVTGLHSIQPYVQPDGQLIQPQPGPSLEPQGPNKKPVGTTNTSKAATGGAKYGGGEAGSALGGLCCPVIGNIIGNCVGEKVGEKVMVETGLDKKVTQGGVKLAGVIGRRNVNKAGEIAMTAFGYAETETCVCCPCLPASQILLVLAIPFFFFNFYKLGVGVDWDWGCTKPENITEPEPDEGSGIDPLQANATEAAAPLIYPCQQGFHYLVVSGAVWLSFLPCWICGLFGNCWRQCCCCCCDPVVIGATITDFIKRCCCECGRFNLCSFFWYTLCAFHVIWAITAIVWLISDVAKAGEGEWVAPREVWGTVVASVVMDFVLAGSEIFHRIRLLFKSDETKEDIEMVEQSQQLNSGPQQNQNANTVQPQGQYLSTVTTQPHHSYTVPPQPQYSGMPQQ